MKSLVSHNLRIATALLAFCLVAPVAFAWNMPLVPATGGNVPAPVNTGDVAQTKTSSFSVVGTSANLSAQNNVNGLRGFFSSLVNASRARFGCFLLTCSQGTLNSSNVIEAGKYDGSGNLSAGFVTSTIGAVSVKNTTLFSNLMGLSGSAGRNAVNVLVSNDNVTNTAGAVLQTNADKFTLFNDTGSDRVGLAVKNLDVSGGVKLSGAFLPGATPAAGMVLTNVGGGVAAWTTPSAAPAQSTVSLGSLVTYKRSATQSSGSQAKVFCSDFDGTSDSEWVAIGGGGYCEYGTQHSSPIIDHNGTRLPQSSANAGVSAIGWIVDCLDQVNTSKLITDGGTGSHTGAAVADVICMKRNMTLVTGTSSGVGGTTPPVTPPVVKKYHDVPTAVGAGTPGQSCVTWLNANTANIPTTFNYQSNSSGAYLEDGGVYTLGEPNSPLTELCAYQTTVGTTTYCEMGSFAAPLSLTIGGSVRNFTPVKSCTGILPPPAQSGTITITTRLYY